jgi:methylmalonyl-CoA mutase cobalamin-binding subunit
MAFEVEDGVRGPRHPMRLVAERTGLSPHVLRVWERRYGAVHPTRSQGRQRLYTDADIVRLQLLQRASRAGRNIGQLVPLRDDALRALIEADAAHRPSSPAPGPARPVAPPPAGVDVEARILERCLAAVDRLDPGGLEADLRRATLLLPLPRLSDDVLVPLLREIGVRWAEGRLGPAQEHTASAVVRRVLDDIVRGFDPAPDAPSIVVGTPAGQRHELGALLAAASASAVGWRVTYLGADLPSLEIARAAQLAGARVVALSVVHPADDKRLREDLDALVAALPPQCQLVIGGASAAGYARALRTRGVHVVDLPSLREILTRMISVR